MNWLKKISSVIPPILKGLADEAQKCNSFEEFRKNYILEIKHGLYWHITNNPNFFIDPKKGPIDASSLSLKLEPSKGSLMITSDLKYWVAHYETDRMYAAIIDVSNVPGNQYKQVSRGFGNEFFIQDASKAKVIKVVPIEEALRIDEKHYSVLPQSDKSLKEFYELAKQQQPNENFNDQQQEEKNYELD